MKNLRLIVRDGMHMFLTANGQELPAVTETEITQTTEQAFQKVGFAEIHAIVEVGKNQCLEIKNGMIQMPSGEMFPYFNFEEYTTDKGVKCLKIQALVDFDFDTTHK